MDKISEEIKEVAEKLEKAETQPKVEPKEALIKALMELGPEGILKKMDSFSDDEKKTLIAIMPEVKKAVSMDDAYSTKYHEGRVYGGKGGYTGSGTVIQEDVANDDADEKLVKPEAAKTNHQGDQTPEGRDENKVEDPKDEKKKKDKMKKSEENDSPSQETLFKSVIDLVESGKSEDEVLETMKKSYDMNTLEVVSDMIKFAIAQNNQRNSMDVECPMYKDLSEMHSKGMSKDYMKGYGMAKGDVDSDSLYKMIDHVVGKAVDSNPMEKSTEDSVKGGNMQGIKPNPEECQVKDNLDDLQDKKVRGDRSRPEDMKVEYDNYDAQKKVNDLNQGQIKKSISWADENALLKGDRGGRNFHYSVNDVLDASLKALKKAEEAGKSVEQATGINATIESGGDDLPCNVFAKAELKSQGDLGAKVATPSFDLKIIGDSMRISPEDQESLIGC